MPWATEIETKLLKLPSLFWGNYTYCEAAFYHARLQERVSHGKFLLLILV